MVTGHDDLATLARRARALRNDRPRLHDHHAPAGLEVLGPLRPVPRLHGRLPRVEETLSPRPGPRPLGRGQGQDASSSPRKSAATRAWPRPQQRALKFFNLRGKDADELQWEGAAGLADHGQGLCRRCSAPTPRTLGTLTAPREFNLMFKTDRRRAGRRGGRRLSAARDGPGHLRQLQERAATARASACPFGIAQMGKSFRNEITPRNFTFRSREFEQMEIEFFCHPKPSPEWYQYLARPPLPVVPRPRPGRRAAAAARPRHGRAEPLLVRHGRHRIRLPVPAAGRVRRAGGHRPSRRFRPAQPHGRQAGAQGRRAGRRDSTPTASRGIAAAART